MAEGGVCLSRLVMGGDAHYWITHSGGSQMPCSEEAAADPWRGPHGEKLGPSAKYRYNRSCS